MTEAGLSRQNSIKPNKIHIYIKKNLNNEFINSPSSRGTNQHKINRLEIGAVSSLVSQA